MGARSRDVGANCGRLDVAFRRSFSRGKAAGGSRCLARHHHEPQLVDEPIERVRCLRDVGDMQACENGHSPRMALPQRKA